MENFVFVVLRNFFEVRYGRFCVLVLLHIYVRSYYFCFFVVGVTSPFVISGMDGTMEIFAVYSSMGWFVGVSYSTTRISCADLRYDCSDFGK